MNGRYDTGDYVLGGWKLTCLLGAGGYGSVYEAHRVDDFGVESTSAIKVITIPQNENEVREVRSEGMDNDSVTAYFHSFVQELVREIAIMSKLKGSPNIVAYEDHAVLEHENGVGWDIIIRMEKLVPLTAYTEIHPLNCEEVAKLGADICSALELCSKYGIIHRDIKPENIFVSEQGDFKLGDFGIARTVEATASSMSRKGTFSYMAPEIYKGQAYGPDVDIYSLGLVMYKFLNENRMPFLPPAPAPITFYDREKAASKRISGEPLPMPSKANPALGKVVLRACAYSRADRFADPAEMRGAIRNACSESTETTQPEICWRADKYTDNTERTVTDRYVSDEALDKTQLLGDAAPGSVVLRHDENNQHGCVRRHRNKKNRSLALIATLITAVTLVAMFIVLKGVRLNLVVVESLPEVKAEEIVISSPIVTGESELAASGKDEGVPVSTAEADAPDQSDEETPPAIESDEPDAAASALPSAQVSAPAQSAQSNTVIPSTTPSYEPTPTPTPVVPLSVSSQQLTLCVGESASISASGGTGNYTWETSDSGVANVSNGTIQAVSEGRATITVKSGTYSSSCTVTVSPVEISLYIDSAELIKGNSYSANVYTNAVGYDLGWSSSNKKVATVSNGTVTAVGAGDAVITVKISCMGHSYSAKSAISVTAPRGNFYITDSTSASTGLSTYSAESFDVIGLFTKLDDDLIYSADWTVSDTDIAICRKVSGGTSLWCFAPGTVTVTASCTVEGNYYTTSIVVNIT